MRRWGWVVGGFDWRGLAHETRRLAEADTHRMNWWSEGALGEMPSEAKTGYPLLDARVPPSAVGRFMRLLAHRMQGKTPPWEEFGKGRRLDAAVAAPNPRAGRRRMESSWVDFLPTQSAASLHVAHALDIRDHRTTTRKLAEAFFEGALTAPYVAAAATRTWGTYEESTEVNGFEAVLRYLVYDVALCYLYEDPVGTSDTQIDSENGASQANDGTTVVTHHSDRMCFPAIPISLPDIPTFRSITNTEGVDWNSLEYTGSCHTETIQKGMKQLQDLGFEPTNPFAPFALVLRSAEAVDAIRNFIASGGAATGMEAAGLLLCGVSPLGGILYISLFIPLLSFILICATPLTAVLMAVARCSITAATKPRPRRVPTNAGATPGRRGVGDLCPPWT